MKCLTRGLLLACLAPVIAGCAGGPSYTFEQGRQTRSASGLGVIARSATWVSAKGGYQGFYVARIDGLPKDRHPRVAVGRSGALAFLPGTYQLEIGLLAFIPNYRNRFGTPYTLQIVSLETVRVPVSIEAGDRFELRTLIDGKPRIDDLRALDGERIDLDWSAVLYDRTRDKVVYRVRADARTASRS